MQQYKSMFTYNVHFSLTLMKILNRVSMDGFDFMKLINILFDLTYCQQDPLEIQGKDMYRCFFIDTTVIFFDNSF